MALKGLKVVELGGLAPAPYCGMILADFGATVTRISKIGERIDSDSLANGKKMIAINLKSPKGVEIVRKICKKSDVLIDPFRAGVMEKLSLGPNVLLEDNKKLIYARLTGFGQSGCYSTMAGHDINYVSVTGLLSLLGRSNEKPAVPANLIADFGGGGLMCAFGILAALHERTFSGQGQVIDANMVEGSAYLGSWIYRSQNMPFWGQPRGQNMLDGGAHFYDTYKTKDNKYMAVGAIEPHFYAILLKGLGLSEETVPQWEDSGKEIFTQKFLEKTQEEWCRVFDRTDACVTPVLSIEEAANHPHNAKRNTFVRTVDNIPAPNAAPRLSRTPAVTLASQTLPGRAKDTVEILKALEYSTKDIQQMGADGIVELHQQSKF
uniref:Alpha-methylacyl-CoA racemase n=2 Tax=Timema TaxID=61471 RepID=A0A7R9APA1_TIMSH|nr:unnamed protein product [Timema shepardi]CAD7577747.1 unnamed protein product [Timema californicum]